MALSNKPKKSKYQVGETVYVLNSSTIASGSIMKVSSSVSNPLDDTNGAQENMYFINGFVQPFREDEVFHSKNAVLFHIKGDYLNKWLNYQFNQHIVTNSNLSFTDFTGADFNGRDLVGVDFDGCKFMNALLDNCKLSSSSMRDCILTDSSISGVNFYGVDLSGATLPTNANTKSTFKSVVGAGNWDPVTTIWTDGLPIGN